MTYDSHTLARELLELPNLPVVIAKGEMGDLELVERIKMTKNASWWDFTYTIPRRTDPAIELS